MKKVTLLFIGSVATALLFSFTSCTNEQDDALGPGGFVPARLTGKWLHGNFAMANFWGYDGSYQGNPFEQSVAFQFTESGHFEMFYIGVANDYGCRSESFSFYKGKVDFNEQAQTFTITPTEGSFRGFYSCASNRNFNRKATAEELQKQIQTFKYGFTEDGKWLMIGGSSFKSTNW
ncbi:hypothetical protein GCM10027299_49100 [Larkinella ripae]